MDFPAVATAAGNGRSRHATPGGHRQWKGAEMALKWYIDAWAPTEGFVFASHRLQTNDPWELDSHDPVMTFAIAAPNFEPQPVDRSAAFGAVRRGFQERFSINGEVEYVFNSIDEIITFARRIYSGSGPGTMGGGGGEPPPETGPEPRGDGGAPQWFASEILDVIMERQQTTFEEVLGTMQERSTKERQSFFTNLITPQIRKAASRLLIECAAEALNSTSVQDAFRLTRTASCFANSFDEWREQLSHVRGGNGLFPEFLLRVFDWHPYPGQLCFETPRLNLRESTQAPVPMRIVQALDLPAKVRTMLDVLSYIGADRHYVAHSSQSGLLPVLLAVAANFSAQTRGSEWYGYHQDSQSARLIGRAIDDCSRFIADWLPLKELPYDLEQEVHAWCLRGPKDQRSYKRSNQSRSTPT